MLKKKKSGYILSVQDPEPNTSRSDVDVSISDADSGYVGEADDNNQENAVAGIELVTQLPLIDSQQSVGQENTSVVKEGILIEANNVALRLDGKVGVELNIQGTPEHPLEMGGNSIMSVDDSDDAIFLDEKHIEVGAEVVVEMVQKINSKVNDLQSTTCTPSATKGDRSLVARSNRVESGIKSGSFAREYSGTDDERVIKNREYCSGYFVHDLDNDSKLTV